MDKTLLGNLKLAIDTAEEAASGESTANPYPALLKASLAVAEGAAVKLAADPDWAASGHIAAALGRVRGAQELHGFAEKSAAAAAALKAAPSALETK